MCIITITDLGAAAERYASIDGKLCCERGSSGPRRLGSVRAAGAFALAVFASIVWAQTASAPSTIARQALDLLLAEKYSDLASTLTPLARERFTEDVLRNQIAARIHTFGQLSSVGDPMTAKDGSDMLVSFPVRFRTMNVNILFTLNPSLQVAALSFRPADAPLPKVWQRPLYSHPDSFTERELTIGRDEWKLGATLTLPLGTGPFPGVVLVHGPGPNDRDETIYSNRMFRDIGEGLASRGIAVLRYDKRTLVYSDKMSEQAFTLEQETVADAVRAIVLLRQQAEIATHRVYVLGHSLGGYATPRIAGRDGKLAGLIFLAANARPIEDVALEQNDYLAHLNGGPTPQAQQRLDALKAEVAKVKSLQPGHQIPQILMGLPGAYLMDLKGYDPAGQAKQLSIPLLFLQGGRDFQVTSKDFGIWKTALAGRTNATFKEYPPLNHLFMAGEGKPGPAEYLKGGNVGDTVISDLAMWIAHQEQ
jgi:uncharacterized protein